MTEQSYEERRKKAIAGLTTLGINAVILLIMMSVLAWKSAGSGPGEYPGIEVNLGFDDQGSGTVEPRTPVGSQEATDAKDAPVATADQPQQQQQTSDATENELKEEIEAKISQANTATDPNSDVEIKEETKETKIVDKKVTDKPVEKKQEPVVPKVDERAVYKGKTTADATKTGDGTGKQGATGNQGDDTGKEGNKGVPGGVEGAAIYKGTPGGGDGGTLMLDGWDWDHIPKPSTPDDELPGRVVFLIEVNDEGELIGYRKESGTVSAAAERACVAAIQKLTFTKKPGAKVPPVSKGKITFVIRNR